MLRVNGYKQQQVRKRDQGRETSARVAHARKKPLLAKSDADSGLRDGTAHVGRC